MNAESKNNLFNMNKHMNIASSVYALMQADHRVVGTGCGRNGLHYVPQSWPPLKQIIATKHKIRFKVPRQFVYSINNWSDKCNMNRPVGRSTPKVLSKMPDVTSRFVLYKHDMKTKGSSSSSSRHVAETSQLIKPYVYLSLMLL